MRPTQRAGQIEVGHSRAALSHRVAQVDARVIIEVVGGDEHLGCETSATQCGVAGLSV